MIRSVLTITQLLLAALLLLSHDATAFSQQSTVKTSPSPPPTSTTSTSTFNVLILRHGQSDANALNVIQGSGYKSRLTAKGKQQAAHVGEYIGGDGMKDTRISSVYCSPLARAQSTWQIVQEKIANIDIDMDAATTLNDLREIDFYDWEGIDKTNLNRMFPKEFAAWKQVKPDELVVMNSAEQSSKKPTKHYPLLELWERADKVWNEILELEGVWKGGRSDDDDNNQQHQQSKTILLIAHGSLGQALLGTAMGWDATHFRKHTFPNCGLVEIEWKRDMFITAAADNSKRRPYATRWRWKYPATQNHLWKYHHNNDILRDLDGQPLTNEYFEQAMNIPRVEYFNTPKTTEAFRGLMSDGARVQLYSSHHQQTAFYKRIVFSELDHAQTKLKRAPFKLLRDTKSYQVVARWLESEACQRVCHDTGVHIPQCYNAQVRADYKNPMNSAFSFLLEDFSPQQGWYQAWLLDSDQEIHAALTTLAKIHAYFWQGSDFWKHHPEAGKELEASIWESGSYVQPKAQNANQCFIVAEEWDKKKQKFADRMSDLPFWDDLGERLQSVCVEAGRLAHPFADNLQDGKDAEEDTDEVPSTLPQDYRQYRTFTHGDPKQANYFFRSNIGDDCLPEVGMIDFQWTGFGLAATDIAHFLLSSIHSDHLVNGGEERLQRYYYDELQKYLVEYGAYQDEDEAKIRFSFATFQNQYDTAVLDLTRLIVSYTWDRFTEAIDKNDEEGKARTMNKTSYNKSVENAAYLMTRCHEILEKRGV